MSEILYTSDRQIAVINRGHDWMAYLVGDKRWWDCSRVSPEAAVAKLRLTAASVLPNADKWPIDNQIQHDTNVAAQDLETASARLSRLLDRMEAEDMDQDRVMDLGSLRSSIITAIESLYRFK